VGGDRRVYLQGGRIERGRAYLSANSHVLQGTIQRRAPS